MAHMPVLNLEERMYKLFDIGTVEALEVFSPAQALPEQNYSTVLDRWKNWSVSMPSAGTMLLNWKPSWRSVRFCTTLQIVNRLRFARPADAK